MNETHIEKIQRLFKTMKKRNEQESFLKLLEKDKSIKNDKLFKIVPLDINIFDYNFKDLEQEKISNEELQIFGTKVNVIVGKHIGELGVK